MTSALRRASSLVLQRLGAGYRNSTSLQQTRHNHDLSAHPNKHIEAWLARREDIEREFRWTPRTVRHVAIMCLLLPILTYNGIVWQSHKDDEYGGRPKRDFLWGHAEAGERRQ